MTDNVATKPSKRKRTVRIDRLNGTKINGESGGLKFIPGETVPRREHPRRAQNFAEYTKLKASLINDPSPENEADQIRMLRYERQSKDAAIFREALAGESWRGRGR